MPIKKVVAIQQKDPSALFAFSYAGNFFVPYKQALVAERDSHIIVLGTSRVMQFRKEFFINPKVFTNAGGAARTYEDIEYFINTLPSNSNVDTIILGLDPEALYGEYVTAGEHSDTETFYRMFNTLLFTSRRIYLDYFAHKLDLHNLIVASKTTSDVGVSALLNKDGFRYDGSFGSYRALHNPSRARTVQHEILIQQAGLRENTTEVNQIQSRAAISNLIILNRVLKTAKEKGITIIGFTPTYPPDLYETMIQVGGLPKTMLTDGQQDIGQVFKDNGEPFFDLSSPRLVEGTEEEFVDAVHGTDALSAKILVYMSNHTNVLKNYVSSKNLHELLQGESHGLLSF